MEHRVKDLEDRVRELETKFKVLSSLLGEYTAKLDVLEEALSNNKRNTRNTLSLDNSLDNSNIGSTIDTQGIEPRHRNVEPAVPLSNLVFSSIEEDYDSTDELKRKVSEVADLIIKTGKTLDYISNR